MVCSNLPSGTFSLTTASPSLAPGPRRHWALFRALRPSRAFPLLQSLTGAHLLQAGSGAPPTIPRAMALIRLSSTCSSLASPGAPQGPELRFVHLWVQGQREAGHTLGELLCERPSGQDPLGGRPPLALKPTVGPATVWGLPQLVATALASKPPRPAGPPFPRGLGHLLLLAAGTEAAPQ